MKAWPIVVAATLVFTASAVGQTPDPYYGDKYKLKRVPARLQNEANRTCRWINERYLSSSIVCPTIYSSTKLGGVDGIAIPSGTVVMYNRTVVAGLPGGATDGVWLTIAVHEFFHRVTYLNSDWTLGTWTEGDRWIEEGVVQAVTNDVMPIVIRKVFNNNVTAQADAYTLNVNAVRALSARVAGQSWQSVQARQIRRQLLLSDRLTRRAWLSQYGVTVR